MIHCVVKLIFIISIKTHMSYGNFSAKLQHREHKIHNIVLYPDKNSWCTTTAIVQVVGHPGCNSVQVENKVCVGACFSYIVPRTVPNTLGDVLPYCDSCQPGLTSWKKVTIECTDGEYKNQNLTKHVEFIHNCNCGACQDQSTKKLLTDEDIEAGEYGLEASLIDDYSLNTSTSSQSSNSSINSNYTALKTFIPSSLNQLDNEDENILNNTDIKEGLSKNVWKHLLDKVQSMDDSIDSDLFAQLIKTVEEEYKIKLNYKRLKRVLLKLKKHQNVAKENASDKSADLFFSKVSPKESVDQGKSPILDVPSQYFKPTMSGSELSYHDTLEVVNAQKVNKINQTIS